VIIGNTRYCSVDKTLFDGNVAIWWVDGCVQAFLARGRLSSCGENDDAMTVNTCSLNPFCVYYERCLVIIRQLQTTAVLTWNSTEAVSS